MTNNKGRNIESIYPLSPMQEGMLYHTLSSPHSGAYTKTLNFALSGDLSVPALKLAWENVARRHPVFRTLFLWKRRKKPLQIVRRRVELPWKYHDLSGLPAGERRGRLEEIMESDREEDFGLDRAPLMRFTLVRMGEDRYRFIWSFHHILMDGWCWPIVFREVFTFYEGFSRGNDVDLEEPRPYKDYIAWLRRQDLSRAESYWRRELEGFYSPTPLALDGAGRAVPGHEHIYGEEHFRLPADVTSALRKFAGRHHLTLNVLVQGAWALLLSRYSGEDDVVFGSVVSGRQVDLAGVESMVGVFINTLPVRVRLSPDISVLDWLNEFMARQIEREQFSYSPLVEIQGWSDVPRRQPLFESIVVFENYPMDASSFGGTGGLEIRSISSPERSTYPITLIAGPGEELSIVISYYKDIFAPEAIRRMLGHYGALLGGMVDGPRRGPFELPVMMEPERRLLIEEWNETGVDYPRDSCIHELFEAQAERTPDAVAVVFGEEHLTYRGLDIRSDEVARRLRTLGVVPEVRVGICMDRSLEMIVGLLGILKAGGAYVPLDAEYPAARLSFIMEDTGIRVLITGRGGVPAGHGIAVVRLDGDLGTTTAVSEGYPDSGAAGDNLAYVMYTSGSTGRPKGVSVVHRGVVRLVVGAGYVEFTDREVFLQLAPLSFDASTFEIWGPLLNGARLVVMSPGKPSLEELGRAVERHGVTVLWLTAGLFHMMIDGCLERMSGIRQLLAGGDILSVSHVKRALEGLGGCRLIDGYGPTEGTTFTCCYDVADPRALGVSVPIGRPIANTRVYVLDRYLQPVPVGITGELYVGGDGLARDYLGRPELTAESFVPSPFGRGERLYRTGDIVRYRPDGDIEFIGRIDHQLKVRGFRIEPGEIESVLSTHENIEECVVAAFENDGRGKKLVAYIVCSESVSTLSLRQLLRENVPDYMVPSQFIQVDEIPHTPVGKVDYGSLSSLYADYEDEKPDYAAPHSELQKEIAGIWEEILGVSRVGLHDNFFDLGGHSLMVIEVISRIEDKYNLSISFREFVNQTLEQFAASCEEQIYNKPDD